jgi:hypothetical protein
MAGALRATESVDFYYRRLESHSKEVESYERRKTLKEDKVDRAMELLMSTLSPSVRATFKTVIPSRDLRLIWDQICQKCGPRGGTEGLSELDILWANFEIARAEAMPDFLQRLEDTADKFKVYGAGWQKPACTKSC